MVKNNGRGVTAYFSGSARIPKQCINQHNLVVAAAIVNRVAIGTRIPRNGAGNKHRIA
jgi:hypothetical protein